ncbi:MAG: hypothetical protein JW909_01660 [Planctomycetes bacterium]|nr:hypothetical protein [Planctomycetota bacterium]
MARRFSFVFLLTLAAAFLPSAAEAVCVNPWVMSDTVVSDKYPAPNTFSMEAFHDSPMFKGLTPSQFCYRLFDIYYDGRRKDWNGFQVGMTLWAHTPQEPKASPNVIELDPVILLNVHGTGYCGIQSGLLEGIYQSRPGGSPGRPAIEARRWYLDGIVHSVCDAFFDGQWHYFDIDLGGWAGDNTNPVWSVADVLRNPKGYYTATTRRSSYFYGADGNGSWVEKINPAKSYAFQDCHMLGHEMSFPLRKGETFTRYFSEQAAGWKVVPPDTRAPQGKQKGYCEIVYAPAPADEADGVLFKDGSANVFDIRCPYNIVSSVVKTSGSASYSTDLGRTWKPLPADGSVPDAVNRWDYLLKIQGGHLTGVTTRGFLHPGALPRLGRQPATMTVQCMKPYHTLTIIPDMTSAEALSSVARIQGLKHDANKTNSFTGGRLGGTGSVTFPLAAPQGTKIVRAAVCVMGGAGTTPQKNNFLEVHIGPAGKTALVSRSTDCSTWGTQPGSKVEHWQNNVNGEAEFPPASAAEVTVRANGWSSITGVRLYVGLVPDRKPSPSGSLLVTHGFDGRSFTKSLSISSLEKVPARYAVPAASRNDFIRMEVK